MKELNIKIKTYAIYDWRIDIIINLESNEYESWLYKAGYGVKHFMYGLLIKDVLYNEFLDMVINNMPDFIDEYIKEVIVND